MRDNALNISDIYVIKQVECNVAITTEFRTWRQELRDLLMVIRFQLIGRHHHQTLLVLLPVENIKIH